MLIANLALRFALELAALAAFAAFAAFGLSVDASVVVRILVALAAVAIFVAVWGRWRAPRFAHRLEGSAGLVLELIVFALAAVRWSLPAHRCWRAFSPRWW
jgi:Protein of unknown function (DUF2568)